MTEVRLEVTNQKQIWSLPYKIIPYENTKEMKANIFKMKYSKGLIRTCFLFSGFGAFQSLIFRINSLQTQLTGIDSTRTPDGVS